MRKDRAGSEQAVKGTPQRPTVVKRKPKGEALDLVIFTPTCSHKLTRSQVEVTEMSYRVAGHSLRNGVRRSV